MAEVYAASGITDESSPAKLQEAKEDARDAADTAVAAAAAKATAVLAGITDETDKKKAAVAAAAASGGGKLDTFGFTMSAESAADACDTTTTGMGQADAEADAVFCTATAARRRALLASSFAVEVIVNTAKVNSTAAVAALKVAQPTVADAITVTQEDPLTVLATIDGVDTSSTAFTEFKAAADESAALEAEASTYETESAEVNVAAGLPAEGRELRRVLRRRRLRDRHRRARRRRVRLRVRRIREAHATRRWMCFLVSPLLLLQSRGEKSTPPLSSERKKGER
jgi:hypothetical protein